MSGLVEFLLTRIAEDEAAARAGEGDWDIPAGVAYSAVGEGSDRIFVHTIDPARVLAECDAKRRIVERCAPPADIQVRRQTRELAAHTLRTLALPYADHPDYRTAWRP